MAWHGIVDATDLITTDEDRYTRKANKSSCVRLCAAGQCHGLLCGRVVGID